MANSNDPGARLPVSAYVPLRFADGSHTGVCIDYRRGIIEVQRRGKREFFDLVCDLDRGEQTCYTDEQITAG